MIEPQGVKLTFNLATGEFNAEGPKEFVEENSRLFRETFISARAPIADRQHRTTQSTAPPQASNSINKKDLEKIFYADPGNGILAITREIRQHKDAVLLILAGFRR
ncbi:MAG: hypothetical protein KGL74_01600, partial [Elusimicrobia bacterium]|nr:hypothetical protein [Elusimicrobiota bacterium]